MFLAVLIGLPFAVAATLVLLLGRVRLLLAIGAALWLAATVYYLVYYECGPTVGECLPGLELESE